MRLVSGWSERCGLKSKMGSTQPNIFYGLGRTPESTQQLIFFRTENPQDLPSASPFGTVRSTDGNRQTAKRNNAFTLLDATNEGTR